MYPGTHATVLSNPVMYPGKRCCLPDVSRSVYDYPIITSASHIISTNYWRHSVGHDEHAQLPGISATLSVRKDENTISLFPSNRKRRRLYSVSVLPLTFWLPVLMSLLLSQTWNWVRRAQDLFSCTWQNSTVRRTSNTPWTFAMYCTWRTVTNMSLWGKVLQWTGISLTGVKFPAVPQCELVGFSYYCVSMRSWEKWSTLCSGTAGHCCLKRKASYQFIKKKSLFFFAKFLIDNPQWDDFSHCALWYIVRFHSIHVAIFTTPS